MQNKMKDLIVLKFGGASVADAEGFHKAAKMIADDHCEENSLVVVVSAMKGRTDELLQLARSVHPNPPRREMDMLVTVGERISGALLAMALDRQGIDAVSLTGSQAGIVTDQEHGNAEVVAVHAERVKQEISLGKVVIVAGFQGVGVHRDITTLGRGGSDISAVALGVALSAKKIVFYKDVPGIFSSDPKNHPTADFFSKTNYDKVLSLAAKNGNGILHARSVLLAKKHGIPLVVRSFKRDHRETLVAP